VVKYTDVTFVLKTLAQSSTDSPCHILSWSSDAEAESGRTLGPEIPALVTRFYGVSRQLV